MKLPDFLTFAPLELLRQKMNAPLVSGGAIPWKPLSTDMEILTGDDGGTVEITDLSEITSHPFDKTLVYKGIRVLVYIKEPRSYTKASQ